MVNQYELLTYSKKYDSIPGMARIEQHSYSTSLSRARKENPTKSPSVNHELLIRGGFIRQEASGIYTLLPFGRRVVRNIEGLIRDEMEDLGAEEISLPVLQPKEYFDATSRWNSIDVLFQLKSRWGERQYGLAATAEEVIVPVVKDRIQSFRDLPLVTFQIGEKFRDEKRAKSGIIRGREFGMKDMYSFHASKENFQQFYDRVKDAYLRIFAKCGVDAKATEASGGDYTALPTHEFQAIAEAGEDTIINCNKCTFAQSSEITKLNVGDKCPKCSEEGLSLNKSVEIGHAFDLGDKYTKAFDLTFTDRDGVKKPVLMGCYGIGTTRLMGMAVEMHHDEKGIIWPEAIAPYKYHFTILNPELPEVQNQANDFKEKAKGSGMSLLIDDRIDVTAGEKFATSDLIGIPNRVIVSKRTAIKGEVEIHNRANGSQANINIDAFFLSLQHK